jgi:phage N-6-adenine-methyltransferase
MSFNPQHLTKTKDSDERYTPKWVFDRLGIQFEIDVCAPVNGPKNTPCKTWYSIETNGLTSDWHGLIYMNPPYSAPKLWMQKFLNHANGIALVATSQGKWFTDAWYDGRTYFVPMPSLKFETANGVMAATAPFRSWLIGIGEQAISTLTQFEKQTWFNTETQTNAKTV